jgi:dTDP-glucose 4,6-dehydratase
VKRVVVTGGAGFLGSHLCERLVADGVDVVCVDNLLTGHLENVAHLMSSEHFTLLRTNVSEPFDVDGPVDAVLHFASPASPPDYQAHPVETLKVGSAGTFVTLDLALAKGARYMIASTSEVYGDPLISPQDESYWGNVNPIGERSMYDEAKRFSEAATMTYHRTLGLDVRVLRIFNVYGPRLRVDGRVVSNFVHQALTGQPLTLFGDGSQTRSFCYVEDEVEGIVRFLRNDDVIGPMNIGNPHEFTVRELAELVVELTGSSSELQFRPLPSDDPKQRRPDISLAREVLGWEPVVPLREGLTRTIAWYREELAARGRIGGSGDPADT